MKDYYDKIEENLINKGYEVFNKEDSNVDYYWFGNDSEPVELQFNLIGGIWKFFYKTKEKEKEDVFDEDVEIIEINEIECVKTMYIKEFFDSLVLDGKSVLDISI